MSDNQQRAQYPEHIFEDPKLRIMMDPNDRQSPALALAIRANYPHLCVWTKDQNDQTNNGRIDGAMEPKTFFKMILEMERIAHSPVATETIIDNLGHVIRKGQAPGPKQLMSKVRIAKDDAGICTISVTAGKNRPILEFTPTDDEYHNFFRDGQPIGLPENTQLTLLSLARMWEKLYSATVGRIGGKPSWMKDRDRDFAQGNRGGQGGGGYQRNNQNSGGYQRNNQGGGGYQNQNNGGGYQRNNQGGGGYQDSFDEDIPI